MFFEQHSLEPNLEHAYFWLTLVKGGRELQQHALEDWSEEGYRALGVMEKHLTLHDFFAANHYTIADIAPYAYTHVAHSCDYDLTTFPAIRAWLSRVAAQPGHITMDWHAEVVAGMIGSGLRTGRAWPRREARYLIFYVFLIHTTFTGLFGKLNRGLNFLFDCIGHNRPNK